MSQGEMKNWEEQLTGLMDQLQAGKIALIEFGDRDHVTVNYFTRLRIRLTKTPGGMQFGMRMVYTFSGEGSGAYYPINAEGKAACIRDAMAEVHRYTAKTSSRPLVKRSIEESRVVLKFAGFEDESHIEEPLLQKFHRQEEAEGRGFLPDATTIILE